jgi:hypothetical protein
LGRLDVYIYDYLMKRNLHASAKAFLNEGKVSSDPVGTLLTCCLWTLCCDHWDVVFLTLRDVSLVVFELTYRWALLDGCTAIDAPGGFLFEWWSVFWDIFIARTNEKHSEVAASYIEVGISRLSSFLPRSVCWRWVSKYFFISSSIASFST